MLMILVSFFLIAKNTSFRSLSRLNQIKQPLPVPAIIVEVSGNVKKPGKVNVPQGSTIRAVLRKARINPTADLTNIDLDRVLESSCALHIPTLEKILVAVEGCVEEKVSVELPAGSRICDLKSRLKLTPDADTAFFRRRKILKNNETIQIPAKNEKESASR
jgi:hypothetical protein